MEYKSKGKTYGTIVFLVILGIAVTIGSFALWNQTRKQTNFNAIVAACLNLTIENESSEITMDYAYPITEKQGLTTTGYTFTVTNTCEQPVSYSIAIESVNDNSGRQFIGNNYIDVSLDGKASSPYGSLDTVTSDTQANYTIRETRALATRTVAGESSRTHTIRMWLDEDTPLTEQNKTFVSKVTLTGGQGMQAGCYTVNGNGVLTDYDPECGVAATVPASVNGHNITKITTSAFKTLKPGYTYSDWDHEYNARSSLAKGTCEMPSGSQTCAIDFSLVYSDKLEPMYTTGGEGMTQEEIAALLGSLTLDDVYVIIYNTDSSTPQYSHVSDAIDYYIENNIGEMSPLLNFDLDDIHRYTYGVDTLPNNGEVAYEQYVAARYSTSQSEWRTSDLGYRMPNGTSVQSLAINSLDLSQATYLTEIEPAAFSNLPELTNETLANFSGTAPTGLTSLTLSNKNTITTLGGGAFAFADLNSLEITTNYQLQQCDFSNYPGYQTIDDWSNPNDFYAMFGAFYGSTIDNLYILDSNHNGIGGSQTCSLKYESANHTTGVSYTKASVFGSTGSNVTIGNLTMGNNPTHIEDGAFVGVTFTSNLVIPDTVTYIGDEAFNSYNGSSLTLPSSIAIIGEDAFWSYVGTNQNLVIPSSARTIKENAFAHYNGSTLTFNEGLQTIENGAFRDYNGAGFTIPSTIQTLGSDSNSVFSFFTGTAHINMTEANFNANVSHSDYWNLRGTTTYNS